MTAYELKTLLRKNHYGKANAVKSRDLEAMFGCKGTDIRNCVNLLRSQGYPICSDASGYYYASSMSELGKTMSQLQSRVRNIRLALSGLERSIKSNQMKESEGHI